MVAEKNKGGRPRKLGVGEHEMLREVVQAQPTATLAELAVTLQARTGQAMHEMTVRRALRAAGVERVWPTERRQSAPGASSGTPGKTRYGYTAAHRRQEPEQRYTSSLTDREWALVADLFERPGGQGLPPTHERRAMVDACCYVVRTGCAWRLLPRDFPPWDNVYKTFRRWSAQGRFEAMHDRLRALWRAHEGRAAAPTAAVLDAQATRGSPQGGTLGFDAGKKVKGRKRHLVVDTLGLLLAVTVTAASVQDRQAAPAVVARATVKYPTVQTLFVDGGYAGRCADDLRQRHALTVQVVRHPARGNGGTLQCHDGTSALAPIVIDTPPRGFVLLPRRWVVERTHAWLDRSRRLALHHDRQPAVAAAWAWLAKARILMRRLTA